MSVNNLVISDFATGYQTNIAPAKLSNDAFPTLEDALIWRNRLKQKDGVKLVGRLRREIEFTLGSTDGAGAFNHCGRRTSNCDAGLFCLPDRRRLDDREGHRP